MIGAADTIDARDRGDALALARRSIAARLGAEPMHAPERPFFARVQPIFVTLRRGATLHGCMGSFAERPIGELIPRTATNAAFEDPRARPLGRTDVEALSIEISLLSELEPLAFASEEDARAQLRPGVDGLVIRSRGHHGLFLPQVWDDVPRPADFLEHLKRKAGLPPRHWHDDVTLERFTVTKIR